ncbi:hypothetical protein DFH07DRAFT_41498 [Mycena maculata]|uniref:F-box domain-containing protein n=1 Tax=Mycena maculata TaxID=230809 RepID=A0AAD7III1_9AGAR|nr:hypothetical protein DFH07DRAFT_41498 [Mycena maculata]
MSRVVLDNFPLVSLDALPNELLYEILGYLTKESDAATPRRYQLFSLFASINRRLRFHLSLVGKFKEVSIPNFKRLPTMIDSFGQHLSRIKYARTFESPLLPCSTIVCSSIHVGHPPFCNASPRRNAPRYRNHLPAASQFSRLHDLNFGCIGFCFDPADSRLRRL